MSNVSIYLGKAYFLYIEYIPGSGWAIGRLSLLVTFASGVVFSLLPNLEFVMCTTCTWDGLFFNPYLIPLDIQSHCTLRSRALTSKSFESLKGPGSI